MLTIGRLSSESGVKVPTIRYYEEIGLLEEAERTAGNQRRYPPAALERLRFIRHARDLGLSLEQIEELVELSNHPDRSCTEAHAIANTHLEHVRDRLRRLKALESELERITASCDSHTAGECNILSAISDHSLCSGEHD
ncbi:MerR family transcriptional regulator [Kiloniella sp. b19]|uniref:MerR family transcriptional regulator n=1 Tax=Kiloniella sp. GXU_MW_B19 TaxID=3141326 RepID=UPI0031DE432F